ncbi:hypothetical protein XM38_039050 [Halomicronema hongdechloris C2206]|uniref:DUF4079 domain-containing protein n=2 Tax=Halomicronema hongdechloris TaxID=1209493 RepID=A0A1Z3HRP5_9CYAN|nr:hypothetical protein XM38_039050 [Halomicronema hongdechloris C2206]
MGLSVTAYLVLATLGGWLALTRLTNRPRPGWVRSLHIAVGVILVSLVLLLLSIGIIGTLGEYGSLGHSYHLPAGLTVVTLVLLSAWSAARIDVSRPWARRLHVGINGILFVALATVTFTGWQVVQKYLP